jgi:RHS repeat-associated protein
VGGSYTTLYTGSSPTYNYTFPSLGSGESQKSYQIELRVRNTSGAYHATTITVTLKRAPDRYYYVKDHLGSVRLTLGEDGGIVSWNDYDPWGLTLAGRSGVVGSADARYQFTSQERDDETGYDYFGARYYDARVGRFFTQDRFKEKYPSFSPYQYGANNPILFVDVNGDSINLSQVINIDQRDGTDYTNTLINDLQDKTGLKLSVNDRGMLVYEKDGDGNPIVTKDGSGIALGSNEARGLIMDAVNITEIGSVFITPGRGSRAEEGGYQLSLDPMQINSFIEGASKGLNPTTQGWAMTLMHEWGHTAMGGGKTDPKRFGAIGDIEKG